MSRCIYTVQRQGATKDPPEVLGFNYSMYGVKKSLNREVRAYITSVDFRRGEPHVNRFLTYKEDPESEGVFGTYVNPKSNLEIGVFTATSGYVLSGFTRSNYLATFSIVKHEELVAAVDESSPKMPRTAASIIVTDLNDEDEAYPELMALRKKHW